MQGKRHEFHELTQKEKTNRLFTLPGQKAPRTRSRKERKGRTRGEMPEARITTGY